MSKTQTGLVATASSTDQTEGIVDAVAQSPHTAAGVTVNAKATLNLNNTTITGNTLTVSGVLDVTGNSTSTLNGEQST